MHSYPSLYGGSVKASIQEGTLCRMQTDGQVSARTALGCSVDTITQKSRDQPRELSVGDLELSTKATENTI